MHTRYVFHGFPKEPWILFLKPKNLYRSWPFSNDFMRHIFAAPSCAFPQLAGAIKDRRIPIRFLDGVFARSLSLTDYATILSKPWVIGISVVGPTVALDTELTVQLIKKVNPGAKIVMGGIHPTFYDREWLERNVDIVVRGEGEKTFPEVIACLETGGDLSKVMGISYRDGDCLRQNPDREFVRDLDLLPMPDWSIVDFSLYNIYLRPGGRTAALETSRGCPYRCTFCPATHMWRHTQRFKSAERVLAELEDLYGRGVRQIVITDDNFGARRDRERVIFAEIQRRGIEIRFWSFLRADLAIKDPQFIAEAARAGLKFVLVGYESLSEAMLDRYAKHPSGRVTIQDYMRAYKVLKQHGIFVYGLFVRDFDLSGQEKTAPWRMVKKVADISAQTRFIPIKGLPGSEQLVQQGYEIKDMFYHDRFWPSYRRGKQSQRFRFVWTAIYDLVKPENFLKLAFGTYVERRFFANLYKGLLSDLIHVTPRGLRSFLITSHPFLSPQEKQQKICNLYLSSGRGHSKIWQKRVGDILRS